LVFLPSGEHYIIEQDGLTILLSKGMYGVEYGMINQDKFVNFLFKNDKTKADCLLPPSL
jgi:hypothetical protein